MAPTKTRLLYHPVQPLSTWSVASVRAAIREHEQGQLARSALLAEQMERNPRIFGALNTRCLAMQGLPFEVEPNEDGDARRSGSVAREVEKRWWDLAPEEVLGDLLRWAVLLGVAIAEVVWDTSGARWMPTLVPVHPALVRWDDTQGAWLVRTTTGEVRVEPGTGRWLVLSYTTARPWMRGVVRCLALEDKIRTESVRDWARWSERHGTPIIVAKTPARASDADKEAFFDGLSDLGSGGTTVLAPQGESAEASFGLDLIEAKTAEASKGFQALIQLVADDAAIAILGQNLTQETKGGSLAAAKVHERVRADYLKADAELLATALRRDVLEPWALLNFGDASLAPWPCWDADEPEDTAAIVSQWKIGAEAVALLRAQGLNVDLVEVAEKLGVPLVKAKPLVEPPPTPPAPGTDPQP
jgi:phage gp29-like protein